MTKRPPFAIATENCSSVSVSASANLDPRVWRDEADWLPTVGDRDFRAPFEVELFGREIEDVIAVAAYRRARIGFAAARTRQFEPGQLRPSSQVTASEAAPVAEKARSHS